MMQVYCAEYLRIPGKHNMKKITQLHHEAHGVQGIFGCLDCMHNCWKNCPKAWQQSYKSEKESGGPTVVLEALSDYHLWFWHASNASSLNDLKILNLSPLLVDGSFANLEESASVVPFDTLVVSISINCLLLLIGLPLVFPLCEGDTGTSDLFQKDFHCMAGSYEKGH